MESLNFEKRDEVVYKQILTKIKTGIWKSGDKLPSEADLCKNLNVSRGTVRSAVQKLASLGFVESKHGLGTFVCNNDDLFDYSGFTDDIEMTPSEYKDITQFREAIEEKAVKSILEMGECTEKENIMHAYQMMEKAALSYDNIELTKYDMIFHTGIIVASGNQLFIRIFRIFHNEYYKMLLETNKLLLRDYPDLAKVKQHFDECLKYHRDLMNALFGNREDTMLQLEKFHERNKVRVEHFFQKREMKEDTK